MGILLAMVVATILVQGTLKIEKCLEEKKRAERFEQVSREFYKRKLNAAKEKLPHERRYDFSANGARFVVYARTETLAWAKARRIANNSKDLRRIA
ncbi:MAG: hypothetical protein NC548_27180 [Lachnospiraceae bacterium]|nr:hypothetical protein [Lachnospiraceae bacterium]